MEKKARFPNLSSVDREEVGYATIPFKKGEWKGEPLLVRDEDEKVIKNSWIFPFGAKYDDDTHRYGALLTKLYVPSRKDKIVYVVDTKEPVKEPVFKYAKGVTNFMDSSMNMIINIGDSVHKASFNEWVMRENNGMRKVFESVSRVGSSNFVADLKTYLCSDQDVVRFELKVTGSNPDNADRTYEFSSIHLFLSGRGLLNIRGHERRGVEVIKPLKHFKLMDGVHGPFGDGQSQTWYGELYLPNNEPDAVRNAIAASEFPFWGMSMDWVECGEAFGALGVVPEPPIELPDDGFTAVARRYVETWKYMNNKGSPWDDYPLGLTKTPNQTGGQKDFALIIGWDVLWTGMAELLESYRFLATEESKRPGHYKESNGLPVTHMAHPDWVTVDSITHYDTNVSRDRLGKTDSYAPYMTNGWKGKDWQHFSSNLLYMTALLTGSYELRDEQEWEVELYLAGHTLPSDKPGWSTNGRGEARGFGRTHLSMCNHWTILDRPDLIERMHMRFMEVVKPTWEGAKRSPVKNWHHVNDIRVIPNTEAWVPWNECLGFPGMVALYNLTKDDDVKQHLIDWGTSLIKYAWRIKRDDKDNIIQLDIGGGIKWYDSGRPITSSQYWDKRYFRIGVNMNGWSHQVPKFIMDSDWYDTDIRTLAEEIYTKFSKDRLKTYDPIKDPFDEWGQWTAIKAT